MSLLMTEYKLGFLLIILINNEISLILHSAMDTDKLEIPRINNL